MPILQQIERARALRIIIHRYIFLYRERKSGERLTDTDLIIFASLLLQLYIKLIN